MPNFIIENKNLCIGAKMLFTILCDYAREKNYCYPSKMTLAKRLNVTLNTLKAWLKQLLSYGFVQILNTIKGNTFYLYSPSENRKENEISKNEGKDTEIIKKVSKINSELSKFDTEVNVKNLKLINPPTIPKQAETKEKIKEGANVCTSLSFDDFWQAYPKKENKESARKAFYRILKLKKLPTLSLFNNALEYFHKSKQWEREEGRFIPQFHNFLSNLRWEEVPIPKAKEVNSMQVKYTDEELASLKKREEQARALQKLEQEKHAQEMAKIDKEWEVFIKYFEADRTINNILAKRYFITLYKQNTLPQVSTKQNIKTLEFLEPFHRERKN